jgi:tight adherence protein B
MNLVVPALAALALVLIYNGVTVAPGPRRRPVMGRLDRLAQESGVRHLTASGLVAASTISWFTTGIVVAGISGSGAVAVVLAFATAWLPFALAKSRRDKRRRAFREAWPDAIATLIASVRAGESLPESCLSLIERGPEELRRGWLAFASSYRATASFRIALDQLRQQLADPIADRVAAALALTHEVGGTDLVRVLRTLGDFVREDIRVRKEIEARWSWTVTAARVAAGAPWLVLLLMSTRPEAAVAYNSASGVVVIIAGAVATILGYRLMLRAARLPEDRRLS